jgi:hypothetical protein
MLPRSAKMPPPRALIPVVLLPLRALLSRVSVPLEAKRIPPPLPLEPPIVVLPFCSVGFFRVRSPVTAVKLSIRDSHTAT